MGYSSRRPSFRAQREIFFVSFFPDFFAKPFMGNTVCLSVRRCFPFPAIRRSPSYRQRKRSLGSAPDDDTGNVLFPHILCMMHGIAIPHAVISSAARNLFHPLFPTTPSLSRLQEAPSHLSAIRCFPFLAVRRSPSYSQRKRSLDFARDDDTRNAPFPLSATRCFPFLAVKHAPSYRQRKRSLDFARDDDTRNAPFPLSAIRCFRFLLSDMHHKQKSHEQNRSWLFHLHASWDYP